MRVSDRLLALQLVPINLTPDPAASDLSRPVFSPPGVYLIAFRSYVHRSDFTSANRDLYQRPRHGHCAMTRLQAREEILLRGVRFNQLRFSCFDHSYPPLLSQSH
ncbi:hypothetical protein LY76DRAFT_591975 [Colletotrichum caudatum]|nr:hypothetical protein LY76DRAFT_591975 [Colletotrichum caudatum]